MDAGEREVWRQADRALDILLDLPPSERAAQLQVMALAPALLARVQRLLAAHEQAAGPLDHALPPALTSAAHEPQALAGRRLGRWQLQQELGRGGMAVVYRAQALEGATGQVAAVKVLTLGALASVGRERFLREQQALLRLRHPYIVPLYDAGIAEDGTPWLAMALVEGERIDHWCAQRALDIEARVHLALQVGEALSYAHRNLVIHRDIKPSNVLVDDDGHVRLLDFGIARLSDEVAAEATATHLRALTPEYAAPEQFIGAPPSTAMDVYGLGALLYRLLAGRAPRASGQPDAGTQILAPSRAARQDTARPQGERRQFASVLRGDLDAIVLKALADEPERRYASVEALCDDLRRWQSRRPIRARAPSVGYRLRKFIARNRIPVAVGAVLALTLTAGVAGTLWQAHQAQQQTTLAQAAQRRSEQALARSNAIRDFLFELFRNTAPGKPREQLPTTRELLSEAVRQVPERFKGDAQTQAEFLSAIGEVYYQRDLPEHLALRRRVLALRAPQRQAQPVAYATAQADVAYSLAATDQAQSLQLFAQAIAQLQRLAPGSKELAYAYRQRATLQMQRQDGAARLRDSESAWKILAKRTDVNARERFFVVAGLAAGHHQAGHYAQALPYYDQAITLGRSAFGAAHAYPATNLLNRSGALSHLGRFDEAEAGLRASLADYQRIFDKPRDYMLANWRELELLYYRQGRFEQALQARDAWDRLLREADPDNRLEQAKSQVWRARDLIHLRRAEEAAVLLQVAMPVLQASGRQERNRLMASSAGLRLACDRPVSTLPREAIEQASSLARAMQGDNRAFAAEAQALAGLCALRSGDPSQALVHLDQAAALDAELPAGDIAEVAEHLLWRGEALAANGDPAAARTVWDGALRRMLAAGLEEHPLTDALRRAGR